MATSIRLKILLAASIGTAVAASAVCGMSVPPAQAQSASSQQLLASGLPIASAVVDHPPASARPEGVVYRYTALMSHRDYNDAYRLLSPNLQQQLPYQDFIAKYGAEGETMQVLEMVLQPQTSSTERLDYAVLLDRSEATLKSHFQEQDFVLVPPRTERGPWEIDQIS